MELINKNLSLYKKNLFQGEVIKIEEGIDSGIIYVRIPEIDQNISNADLSPCYPVNNFQFLRILPKKGERVFVVMDRLLENTDVRNNQEKRYWYSLSIPNVTNINYSPFYFNSNSHETDGWIVNDDRLKNLPFSDDLKEDNDSIVLRGRENTDISLRTSEVLIRAGRHINNIPPLFNNENPSFIQLLYEKPVNTVTSSEKFVKDEQEVLTRIFITNVDTAILIKIINIDTNSVLETFSKTYENMSVLKADVLPKIYAYQQNYKFWEIIDVNNLFPSIAKRFITNKVSTVSNAVTNIENNSSINLVSDYLNILSHKTFKDLALDKNYVNSDILSTIKSNTDPMVKGDQLIELLRLIILFLNSHSHPYPNMSPTNDLILNKINEYNLKDIVNEYLRIG